MTAAPVAKLPERKEVLIADTWNLDKLFPSDDAWDQAFKKLEAMIPGYARFQGKLGESAQVLAECLQFDLDVERLAEGLGVYAFLRTAEDQTNSRYQKLVGRFQNLATRAAEQASFMRPEILALPEERLAELLDSAPIAPYRLMLERLARYKPHTLGEKEEQLLAMQGEMAGATSRIFRQLHDADLKFGFVEDETGQQVELSNSTFMQLLYSPKREVRKTAFHQYYEQFVAHENSLAAILGGSIQKDVYYARARGYESALQSALFADNVPTTVYDNLVQAVRDNLPEVHRYYDLRRRKMELDEIHHYDTYVPILSDIDVEHTWEQAVDVVIDSLAPLGEEYTATLREGLTSARWCDRYPNKGKQSGAFSSGTYDADPYILMNFKPKVINDVFTLTHEAGHSMHSFFSNRNQPFAYHDYTIFVAEVASTFNEQLLTRHLLENANDDRLRAYLINNEIDSIRATVVRQTMFAEFEKTTHAMAEAGEPLTVESFKEVYRGLLDAYFGPEFTLDDELSLECFRIPHFYRAFYVYKYATGLSAAIALSERVLSGGDAELNDYLNFLKGGCSKYPLDLLRDAGVDLEQPEPVHTALNRFGELVSQLDQLL